MENIRTAIDAVTEKEATTFKEAVRAELMLRVMSSIASARSNVAREIMEVNVLAPSAPPASTPSKKNAPSGVAEKPMDEDLVKEIEAVFGIGSKADEAKPTAKDDDISLDPNFEKEYLSKSMTLNGKKVQFKQIGLGLSKPIRVYIDGQRWELFPGPEAALKATKEYMKELEQEEKIKKNQANQGA